MVSSCRDNAVPRLLPPTPVTDFSGASASRGAIANGALIAPLRRALLSDGDLIVANSD